MFISSCNRGEDTNQCVDGTNNTISYSDYEGDAAFSIIDLGNLSVTINNCEVKAKISLLNAPVNLVYNSANISDNSLEYLWEVKFDVDGDGTAANDIQLSISHFKPSGSTEAQGNVPEFTQSNLWLVSSDGLSGTDAGPISTSLSGSTLTLVVSVSENPALLNITKDTPVQFETYYNSSGTVYNDRYPDVGYAH